MGKPSSIARITAGQVSSLRRVRGQYRRLFAVILTSLMLEAWGCEPSSPKGTETALPEVDVAHPVVRESVEWDEYTGRLAAVETVEVRCRVTGFLDKIHFKPGQIVKKGDLLFTIDRRPFQAELDRANADVQRAKAELEHAEYDLHRVEQFKKDEIGAEKEYRDFLFAEHNARSNVDRTTAEERIAELNLEWTEVVAPISGRISRESVTVGNLVREGSSGGAALTTIVSLDPIHCYFDADEQAYLKYTRMSRSGERVSSRDKPNPVRVALFDESDFVHEGQMDFVDNAMDQLTGTIRGRAILPNPDGLLIPGLFVRVRLIGSGVRPMVFVPDTAIATDQTTRLVFVVDGKNVIHPRPVSVGRLQNGLRRIVSGLDGTETIVVNGVQRVRTDAQVKPVQAPICSDTWTPEMKDTCPPTSKPESNSPAGGTP